MRFFVTRTSTGYEDKPCEEAEWVTYTQIDRRTVADPLKIPVWAGRPEKAQREWYGRE